MWLHVTRYLHKYRQCCHDNVITNIYVSTIESNRQPCGRALCRIKLLPVTHVLVDTWMLTVKLVYELSSVSDDLKWATNTHMTPFTLTFNIYGFGRPFFCSLIFYPVHPYFCPSIFIFTRPNDGWTGIYIKLCHVVFSAKYVSGIWIEDYRRNTACDVTSTCELCQSD